MWPTSIFTCWLLYKYLLNNVHDSKSFKKLLPIYFCKVVCDILMPFMTSSRLKPNLHKRLSWVEQYDKAKYHIYVKQLQNKGLFNPKNILLEVCHPVFSSDWNTWVCVELVCHAWCVETWSMIVWLAVKTFLMQIWPHNVSLFFKRLFSIGFILAIGFLEAFMVFRSSMSLHPCNFYCTLLYFYLIYLFLIDSLVSPQIQVVSSQLCCCQCLYYLHIFGTFDFQFRISLFIHIGRE